MPRSRGATWQADITIKDSPKGRYRMDGFSTERAAEIWELQCKANVLAGKEPPPGPGKNANGVTLQELFNKTCSLPAPAGWRGALAEDDLVRNGQRFLEWKGASFPAKDISSASLDEYVEHLRAGGFKGSTINRRQAAVTKMFRVGEKHFGLTRVRGEHQAEGGGRIRVITPDEEATIIKLSRQWNMPDMAMLAVALMETGARIGEVARRMALGDFFEAPHLRDAGRVRVGLRIKGTKTEGSKRTIVATDRLLEEVVSPMRKRGLESGAFMFPFKDGDIYAWWDRLRVTMGLEDDAEFVPHAYRHTSCTRMFQLGEEAVYVMRWHGHSNIKTTLRYTHLALSDMAGVAERRSACRAVTELVTEGRKA